MSRRQARPNSQHHTLLVGVELVHKQRLKCRIITCNRVAHRRSTIDQSLFVSIVVLAHARRVVRASVDDAAAQSRPQRVTANMLDPTSDQITTNIQQPTGNARCDSEITLKVIVNVVNQLRDDQCNC
jgi:hypothetical protein